MPQSRREYWQPKLTRNQQRDDRVRGSWIVGLIEAVEKGNAKGLLQAASLAFPTHFEFLDHSVLQKHTDKEYNMN